MAFGLPLFLVDSSYFERREFSFTLSGDIYVRYQSFSSFQDLLRSLSNKVPQKIDIGAVFNINPIDNRKNLVSFIPLERELVFDIDMTDYDDTRTCCKNAEICKNCWQFMIIAAKILDQALRSDFDFNHILWVYSGRRGIHGWVCDEKARKLSTEARSAIVDYLSLVEGGEMKIKRVTLGNKGLHPSIVRSVKIIDQYWEGFILEQQKILETKEDVLKVIELCPDLELKNRLINECWENSSKWKKPIDKWNRLVAVVESHLDTKRKSLAKYFINEIKLQTCYPRLDVNVSKGLNHLLKSPFSVHPKTGRICVPIDIANIDAFDPFKVPTIEELSSQIDDFDRNQDDNCPLKLEAYEKTALKESINLFKAFIANLEKANLESRKAQANQSLEF